MRVGLSVYAISALLFTFSGCTTYYSAASKGNVKAIERLWANGEDVNAVDDTGMTPLIYAVKHNQKEALLVLLKSGAHINQSDAELGNTPLMHAILQGNSTLVRILLDKGADVDIRNKTGLTAVDLIKKNHNDDLIRLVQSHSKNTTIALKEMISDQTKTPAVEEKITPATVAVVPVVSQNIPISEAQARVVLQRFMAKHETLAVRNFLNQHPEAIALITDPRQKLRYIGPNNWRIMDIAEGISRGSLTEKQIIEHIESAALPYKQFNEDEIRIISHYGISKKIIDAMMRVTH